jgi:nicotinate-nucleotide pyrophosphorylase (carboxylating)
MFLPRKVLEEKLLRMLAEDVGQGDVTTALVAPATVVEAEIAAKESGIVAGVEETRIFLECLGLKTEAMVHDGDRIEPGQNLFRIVGDARVILSAERTVLNLLSRMSGIATTTRTLVKKILKAKLKTRVACTRKTAPGLLYFDKKAVHVGGGDTHRLHLDDMVLIKDNHIAVAGSIGKAVQKARKGASFCKKIEVEVTGVEDALVAAKAGADIVMLDNFSPKQVEKACKLLRKAKLYGKVLLEASGGITSDSILQFASTGVDIVSLGELTNNSRPLDMSLEIRNVGKAYGKTQPLDART